MKLKRTIPVLFALLAVLVGVGCNTGNVTTGGGDKVSLEVKLEPGTVYKQVSKTEQKMTQTMMGMKTTVNSITEIFFKNEVVSVDADGVASIKCTYERVRMETDNSMTGKQSFDSDKPTEGNIMESAGYKGLIGQSITFKMDKRGTVVDVDGVDSLFASVLKSVGADQSGPEMAMVEKTLKATFGDEGMKSMMQAASIQYPDVLVAVGDTWGKQISTLGMMPMKMEMNYKVDHIDADKVVLSFEGTVTSDKDKALDFGPVSVGMDVNGNTSGTAEISRKNGMILTSTTKNDLSGSMTTMSIKMPMSIDQTVTVSPY